MLCQEVEEKGGECIHYFLLCVLLSVFISSCFSSGTGVQRRKHLLMPKSPMSPPHVKPAKATPFHRRVSEVSRPLCSPTKPAASGTPTMIFETAVATGSCVPLCHIHVFMCTHRCTKLCRPMGGTVQRWEGATARPGQSATHHTARPKRRPTKVAQLSTPDAAEACRQYKQPRRREMHRVKRVHGRQ